MYNLVSVLTVYKATCPCLGKAISEEANVMLWFTVDTERQATGDVYRKISREMFCEISEVTCEIIREIPREMVEF